VTGRRIGLFLRIGNKESSKMLFGTVSLVVLACLQISPALAMDGINGGLIAMTAQVDKCFAIAGGTTYGCWCGAGHCSKHSPRRHQFRNDEIDKCCKAHDLCYDTDCYKKGKGRLSENLYNKEKICPKTVGIRTVYIFHFDAKKTQANPLKINCPPNLDRHQSKICKCDKAFANCLQKFKRKTKQNACPSKRLLMKNGLGVHKRNNDANIQPCAHAKDSKICKKQGFRTKVKSYANRFKQKLELWGR